MAVNKEDAHGSEMDRRTVFVRNLAFSTTQAKLEEAFTVLGPVRQCFLVKDKGSEQHKGFGFVQFALAEDAAKAVESKHGSTLDGRKIKVEVAKKRASFEERKTKRREPGEPAPGFKKEEAAAPAEPAAGADGQGGEHAEAKAEEKEASVKVEKAEAKKKKEKDSEAGGSGAAEGLESGLKKAAKRKPERAEGAPPKKPRQEGHVSEKQKPARTVVFGNLASPAVAAAVVAKVRTLGPLEQLRESLTQDDLANNSLAKDGCKLPAASAVFESVRAARAAVAALHGQKVAGELVWARELGGEGAKLKKWRLIVRNLPFQAKEAALRELASKAGFVWQLTVPRGTDGRLRGFAFVGYTSKADAEKAIATLNGEKIGGRAVVVDWAVAKNKYEAHMAQAQETEQEADEDAAESADDGEGASSDEEDYDREAAGGQPTDEAEGDSGSSEAGEEGSDDDAEIKGRKGEAGDEGALMRRVLQGVMEGSGGAKEAEEAGGVAVMDEEDDQHAARRELSQTAGPRPKDSPAAPVVSANKARERAERPPPVTVFVRNLPVDVDVNEARRKFAVFGTVTSCRLVKHKLTNRPKGTAFVDFANKEAAEAAVACSKGASGAGLVVGGKSVLADLAVGKEEAKDMAVGLSISVRDKDKRNIYLAEEGTIKEGTPAAAEMSKADVTKRQRLAQEKASKLRSPNFFVSPTRLAVHNVPKDLDEKELKHLVLSAVKERATKQLPQLKQVKILRDEGKGGKDGPGKSRGAAFVEFTEHQHALVALRALNNNPGPFGAEHRPIVEFAIENRLKLRQREMQQARKASQQTSERSSSGQDREGEEGLSRDDRKRKRREEKRKVKKEERLRKKQQEEDQFGAEVTAGAQDSGPAADRKKGRKRKVDSNGAPGLGEGDRGRKAKERRQDRGGEQKAKQGPAPDLAEKLGLPEGEMRAKGAKPLSRKERKKAQAGQPIGEDRLDRLVAEYKSKYFQGGGASQPAQQKNLIASDLSRWYE